MDKWNWIGYSWTSVFEEIKDRRVENILFVSIDGLTGSSIAIEKI